MKKLTLLAFALPAVAVIAQSAAAEAPVEKYNKACAVCHANGTANAPKTHDVEAWKPRLEKGMDALVQSVANGLNAMPPKGMCFDCSEEDYKALITYMSSPAE